MGLSEQIMTIRANASSWNVKYHQQLLDISHYLLALSISVHCRLPIQKSECTLQFFIRYFGFKIDFRT